MNTEIQALLDHATYCRKLAAETAHLHAARRLIEIATEYECRARALTDGRHMSN
jgi:hypothetical protein